MVVQSCFKPKLLLWRQNLGIFKYIAMHTPTHLLWYLGKTTALSCAWLVVSIDSWTAQCRVIKNLPLWLVWCQLCLFCQAFTTHCKGQAHPFYQQQVSYVYKNWKAVKQLYKLLQECVVVTYVIPFGIQKHPGCKKARPS